jgi:hypothetical protein
MKSVPLQTASLTQIRWYFLGSLHQACLLNLHESRLPQTKMKMECKIHLTSIFSFSLFLTYVRDVDPQENAPPLAGASSLSGQDDRLAVVVRDSTNWLSMLKNLQETDVIILLTPVVVPISQDPTDLSDPFEPLGRSLAKRHPRVRHVPYTQRSEI